MTRLSLIAVLLGLTLCTSFHAHASTVLFSLAIGYNGRPTVAQASDVADLHFADDDALAVHEFARTIARRSFLLTIPER